MSYSETSDYDESKIAHCSACGHEWFISQREWRELTGILPLTSEQTAFESWMASGNYPEIADIALAKLDDGNYKSQLTFAAWQAWQAASRLLTTSEKRASEAERTFAGLHVEMAKIVALNAQLVRERDEAKASWFTLSQAHYLMQQKLGAERDEAVRERDGARAVVDRLAREAEDGLKLWEKAIAEDAVAVSQLQSERDFTRAALGKVDEIIDWHKAQAQPDGAAEFALISVQQAIRTALTHTGNDG